MSNTLIFINLNVPDYDMLIKSTKVDITDYHSDIKNITNRIGFLWENNNEIMPFGLLPYNNSHYFTKEFVDYLLKYSNPITVDLISCSLNSPVFKNDLKELEKHLPHVTFNYTTNQIGNNEGWILNSSNKNIKQIYFNDLIDCYKHDLGLPNENLLNSNFSGSLNSDGTILTYILNNNFSTNGWSIKDLTHADSDKQVIIDGNNKTITITDDNFSGLFYVGNNQPTKPTIIKNFILKSNFNISVALAKITESVIIENCHLELLNANIKANGGGLVYNSETPENLNITLNNCSAKIFGKVGGNSGPLIGYIASNSGSIYNINNCFSIISDNSSGNGQNTLGSGAGAFLGSGVSNNTTINSSYCIFNGSMSYGSAIIGGKFLGSSGTLTINRFYAVTNITSFTPPSNVSDTDPSHYSYYLSSYHGGSEPTSFSLSNVNVLCLGSASKILANVYGHTQIYTSLANFAKQTSYDSFSTSAHQTSSIIQINDAISTIQYKIKISGTDRIFYGCRPEADFYYDLNITSGYLIKVDNVNISLDTNTLTIPSNTTPSITWQVPTFLDSTTLNSLTFKYNGITTVPSATGSYALTVNEPIYKFNRNLSANVGIFGLKTLLHPNYDVSQLSENNVSSWNGFTSYGSNSTLPTYSLNGGINGGSYVTLNKANGQYFNGGTKTLNICENEGFTLFCLAKFNSREGWERIVSFGNGTNNENILLGQQGNNAQIFFQITDGTKNVKYVTSQNLGLDNWNVYGCRYNNNSYSRTGEIRINNVVNSSVYDNTSDGLQFQNITTTASYIGKSSGTADLIFDGSIGGVYVFDRYLSDFEMTSMYNFMVGKSNDYNLIINPSTLVIGQPLSITVKTQTIEYGTNFSSANFITNGLTISGLVSGHTITGITLSYNNGSGVTALGANPIVGVYNDVTVTASTGSGGYLSTNYVITVISGTITISQKPLIIRAQDRTMVYGDGLTLGTSSWVLGPVDNADSLVTGDSISSVDLKFNNLTTVPNRLTNGTYTNAIIPSNVNGSRLANYSISYSPGTLVVTKKEQIINIHAPRQVQQTSGYAKSAIVHTETLVSPDTILFIDYNFNGLATVPTTEGNYVLTLQDKYPKINYNKQIPYFDSDGTIMFKTPMFLLNPQTLNLPVDTVLTTSSFTGTTWSDFIPKTDGSNVMFLGRVAVLNQVNPKYFNNGGYLNNKYIEFNIGSSYKNYIQKISNTTPINLKSNGGLTIFCLINFSNSIVGEAIIDFFETSTKNRIYFGRDSTTHSKLNFTLYCGSTLILNQSTSASMITPGSWNLIGIRIKDNTSTSNLTLEIYNVFTNTKETFTSSTNYASYSNVTPTILNISKTHSTKYTGAKLANLFIFDKYLSDSEVITITDYLGCVNTNYNYLLQNNDGSTPVNATITTSIPILNINQLIDSDFPEFIPSSGGFAGFGQKEKITELTISFDYNHDNLSISLVDQLGQLKPPIHSNPTNFQDGFGNPKSKFNLTAYHPGLIKVNLMSNASATFQQDLTASTNVFLRPRKPSGVEVNKSSDDGSYVQIIINNDYAKTEGVGNYNIGFVYQLRQNTNSFTSDYIIVDQSDIVKNIDKSILGAYSGTYGFIVNKCLNGTNQEDLNYDTTYYLKFKLIINGALSDDSNVIEFTTGFAGTNFRDSVNIEDTRYTMSPEDFSGTAQNPKNYSQKDLSGIVIGGGSIHDIILSNIITYGKINFLNSTVTNLTSVNSQYFQFNINNCEFQDSTFQGTIMENSDIQNSSFTNCNFSRLRLRKQNYDNTNFVLNYFTNVEFTKCNLNDSELYGAEYRNILMDITTDPTDIKTRETMKNTLSTEQFDFTYYPNKQIIDYITPSTIEAQNELSDRQVKKQLELMKPGLAYSPIPKQAGTVIMPKNSRIPGTARAVVVSTGALTQFDSSILSLYTAISGQADASSDIAGMSGTLSGLEPNNVLLFVAGGPKQQPTWYPPNYVSPPTTIYYEPNNSNNARSLMSRDINLTGKTVGQIHDEFIASYIENTYGIYVAEPNNSHKNSDGTLKTGYYTGGTPTGGVVEYTFGSFTSVDRTTIDFANQILSLQLKGGKADEYESFQQIEIVNDVNGYPRILIKDSIQQDLILTRNANGEINTSLNTGSAYSILGIPYGITPKRAPMRADTNRISLNTTISTSILFKDIIVSDIKKYINATDVIKAKLTYNVTSGTLSAKLTDPMSTELIITGIGNVTIECTLPADILYNEEKVLINLTIEKPLINSKAYLIENKQNFINIKQNAEKYDPVVPISQVTIPMDNVLKKNVDANLYVNNFESSKDIPLKTGLVFTTPGDTIVAPVVIDSTNDPAAEAELKSKLEINGRKVKEIIKIITDTNTGTFKYNTTVPEAYLAGHLNSVGDNFDSTIGPTIVRTGQTYSYQFPVVGFSYWVIFSTSNESDTRIYQNAVLAPLRTGGDPIIHPLIGPKYSLAPHIKYVNLLADYSKKIFINAEVDMLKQSDFPEEIYWDNSFSKTAELKHIYFNSYYRRFFIYFNGESIEIDADTLVINKITELNKIKIANTKSKKGLKSISFNKTYPLFESTKEIKIGFDNLILTLTSDIKTDDRHHLDLLNVKTYNFDNVSGALISKDQIIKISNLVGPELFEYDSNPFLLNK